MDYAYSEIYLEDAMTNLADAIDYAVNECGLGADEFLDMFIASGIARQFEHGNPKFVAGMSGIELVRSVVECSGKNINLPKPLVVYDCSAEYWSGWILAYYQWHTGRSFKNIKQHITMEMILNLYPTLHEASEDKFVDVANAMIERQNPETRLQFLRRALGYSQRMLAEKSGVSLRMIQQYEQRAKDINKASASNLLALAKTLGCHMEDLMEVS